MSVSVVIPTYNRGAIVGEAIASVLRQTSKPDQIIVVDDGSTDGTAAVLQKYGSSIEVITQPNRGVSAARNAGIKAAKGDWIAFLDSDDDWLAERLAILKAAIEDGTSGAGVHVADHLFTGPGYNEALFQLRGFSFRQGSATLIERPLRMVASGLSLNSIACRRDWVREAGGFDESMRMFEDLDLLCRLSLRGSFLFQPVIVGRVRRIPEARGLALTVQAAADQARTAGVRAQIFRRLLSDSRLDRGDRRLARERLSGAYFDQARALTTSSGSWASWASLMQSARAHPSPRGWLKAAALFALGTQRYDRLMGPNRGFHREDFEDQ